MRAPCLLLLVAAALLVRPQAASASLAMQLLTQIDPADVEHLYQPGWQEALHAAGVEAGIAQPRGQPTPAAPHSPTEPWLEQISEEPRAFVYHNFLRPEEADHLIALARPHLAKSKVIVAESGKVEDSKVRTSSGAWIQRAQDPVVAGIERRISAWTGAPVENAEPMHVLHYGVGEEYQPHVDFFVEDKNTINGGQRVATILLYLNDVPEGGETVFPFSKLVPAPEHAAEYSECARKGTAAKARKGDALLFYSVLPNGQSMDVLSTHAGCPVLKGEKYVASVWLRQDEWVDAPASQVAAVKPRRGSSERSARSTRAPERGLVASACLCSWFCRAVGFGSSERRGLCSPVVLSRARAAIASSRCG